MYIDYYYLFVVGLFYEFYKLEADFFFITKLIWE